MTKKYRRQKRKGFLLKSAAFILAGLIVVAALFLTFRGKNAGSSSVGGTLNGTPAALVDPKGIDMGNMKDFTTTTFTIKITNTGTGTLRFTDKPYVQVVQGCCPPELSVGKMALNPGESTTVTSAQFYMHPGMDGKHDYAVHILTNDPAQTDLVVHVLSNWSQ